MRKASKENRSSKDYLSAFPPSTHGRFRCCDRAQSGENGCCEDNLDRTAYMQEMMQRAQALGANAIVGIDIDYETVEANGSMLMVATSGTAVVI